MKRIALVLVFILSLSSLLKAQESLDGIWLGTLKLPNAELRLAIIISNTSTAEPEALLNSLDQGGVEVPMDKVTLNGDTLEVSGASLGLKIKGIVDLEEEKWTSTFTQGPAVFPLIFNKVDHLPWPQRPQEPKPPLPYSSENVVYENAEAGISLAGTLTIPKGDGPFPAVILLSGSGAQDRNEALLGHKPFLVLSDYLTRQGIAVLRSDDRGVGESGGSFSESTTEDFAKDALAGIKYLEKRPEINKEFIGLAGHSEGGMMAPIAAVKSTSVDFIVLMAAPGIPFDQIILFQKKAKWIEAGLSEDQIGLLSQWHQMISDLVKSELSDSLLGEEIFHMYKSSSEEELANLQRNEKTIEMEINAMSSPWWRYASKYDPVSTLKQVACPVLAINGTKDTQVEASVNLSAIQNALHDGKSDHHFTRDIDGLNHMFQTAETGDAMEYGKIEETFSPIAMRIISEWILELLK